MLDKEEEVGRLHCVTIRMEGGLREEDQVSDREEMVTPAPLGSRASFFQTSTQATPLQYLKLSKLYSVYMRASVTPCTSRADPATPC